MPSASKAQSPPCPSDIFPLNIPWTQAVPFDYAIPHSGCRITVYYCYRKVPAMGLAPDQYETYVYYIEKKPGYNCTGIPESVIIGAGVDAAFQDMDRILGFPQIPCGDPNKPIGLYTYTVYKPTCWHVVNSEYSGGYSGCSGSRCKQTCQWCYSNGGVHVFDCTYLVVPPEPVPSCPPPPPAGTPWISGVCYEVDCGPGLTIGQ